MARNLYLAVVGGSNLELLDDDFCMDSSVSGRGNRVLNGDKVYKVVTDSKDDAISAFDREHFRGAHIYRAEEPLENINELISQSEEGVVERVPSKEVSRYLSLETVSLETD